MIPLLDKTLHSVPMLATLDVRSEVVEVGRVVLRVPPAAAIVDHAGNLHTSVLFAVGELAASTVVGTHPALARVEPRLKSSRIKYYAATALDVSAHAELPAASLAALLTALNGEGAASAEILVRLTDPNGREVAQLASHFSLLAPGSP